METLLVLLAIVASLVTAFVAAAVTLEVFLRLACHSSNALEPEVASARKKADV